MDQDDYPTFQYGSEDISDDILECNSIPIAPLEPSSFICHLEHVTTISNPEYSNVSIYASDPVSVIPTKSSSSHNLEHFTSSSSSHNLDHFTSSSPSHNLERFTSSSNNLENFTSLSDNLNDSDSSNTLLQNTKKHKSIFVASSTKKPKPRKIPVERNRKIVSCGESFALTSSTSTIGAHLRTIHRLSEKGSLLPLSGTSERLASKKPVAIAQKDPMQPTLLDMLNKQPSLSSNKKNKLTSRILAWIIDDMHAFNVLENEKFHDLMYEAEPRYQIPCQD
ncbi:4243_t:CDS:2, partial [Gigaspora rosea]